MNKVIKDFYGFSSIPFSKEITEPNIFITPSFQEASGMLLLAIEKEDIVLLTGEIGVGKSVVLRSFIYNLDENDYLKAYIRASNLSSIELYKSILAGLNIVPPYTKSVAKLTFYKKIPELNKKIIIIIDDAHEMKDTALLELKSLCNFSLDSVNRLTIILTGQTELIRKIKMEHLKSLKQRIRLSVKMVSLSCDECARYIDHWIKICGNQTSIFTESAKADIYKKSNGVPRQINTICYNSIIQGAVKKLSVIDSSDICVPDLLKE